MPNHIKNRVTSSKYKEMMALMKSEDRDFDFNKVIPMPFELKDTRSPSAPVPDEDYERELKKYERESRKAYKEGSEWCPPRPISVTMSEKYKLLFGADNWYDWSVRNWGTKWNAYSVIDDGDVVEFETAWSMPEPVFKKLSQVLKAKIEVEYADEDLYSLNCGKIAFDNGRLVYFEEGDYRFARSVWGLNPDCVDCSECGAEVLESETIKTDDESVLCKECAENKE